MRDRRGKKIRKTLGVFVDHANTHALGCRPTYQIAYLLADFSLSLLHTRLIMVVVNYRHTQGCFAWWWIPTSACQFTRRRSSTCTKARRGTKYRPMSSPSPTRPTGPCCKVGYDDLFLIPLSRFLRCPPYWHEINESRKGVKRFRGGAPPGADWFTEMCCFLFFLLVSSFVMHVPFWAVT